MPNVRLSMRKTREVLRLHAECRLSRRAIARALGISPATVGDYVGRAKLANLTWPLPEDLDDERLERLLFPPQNDLPTHRASPEWPYIHRELHRPGVTLQLLWEEYKASHPDDGYQYSRFCDRYRAWAKSVDVTMRQHHKAGEKLFVDYAGDTLPVTDPHTGEVRLAQIFVAVLGASSYTYAEASWSQGVPDWVSAHIRAFEFLGGVPALVIPDNLKSGVTRPCRYEPDVNPAYQEMARHYGTAIVPARVRKPRDKAKAESGVLLVERWILAVLRNRTFFSLAELNQAIRELLVRLNERAFKKLDGCRKSLFEQLDRPALKPLPAMRHEVSSWKKARVGIDYHIELEGHYYSVPFTLARQEVELRFTATTLEVFHKGRRVASHVRSRERGRHTTLPAHMPPAHEKYLAWTSERITAWAAKSGEHVAKMASAIMAHRDHPAQGYRACMGFIRLERKHGAERLDAACRRALHFGTHSFTSVDRILKQGLEAQPLPAPAASAPSPAHANVRGADYYAQEELRA